MSTAAIQLAAIQLAAILLAAFLGAVTWTFLEYVIHRWLGHDVRFRPNFFAKEHVRHHSQGDYFAPAWKKGGAALVTLLIVGPPAVALVGWAIGGAYATGLVGFYLFYEVLHRREHTSAGFGAYGRWARRHHFWHHFGNAQSNHGVTTPFWDMVFGTYEPPKLIVVPDRLKMQWLVDPSTGDLAKRFAGQYQIRRARRAA